MPIQPRVFRAAPTEILLHHALHRGGVTARQLERRRENHVAPVVKDGVVISELHIVRADGPALPLFAQDFARLEDFGQEHRSGALRRRRHKVEVLPNRAANCAGNPHIVLQPGPAAANTLEDEIPEHGAAFRPESTIGLEPMAAGAIPDHQAAKAPIRDQDVGTETQHKVRHAVRSRRRDRVCQFVGGARVIEKIGGTADLERRERRQRDGAADPCLAKRYDERVGIRRASGRHATKNTATRCTPTHL